MNKILPWMLLGASGLSQAQTVPDAGALSQPMQRGERARNASAIVPPVTSPEALPIQVVDTDMAGLRFEYSLSLPSLKALVENIYAAQVTPGQPLNEQQLERAALLSSDLGVSVVTTLQPGATPQSTDVEVQLTQTDSTAFSLGADNAGSAATGEYRLYGSGRFGNLLAAGDRLQWDATHTEGSDFARLAFSVPVGYDGWRVGLNASGFNYRLISADLAPLQGRGSANSLGLEASFPIVLTRQHKLQFTLNYDNRAYDNQANNATTSHYRVNSLGVGLLASRYDAASNAYSTAAVSLVGGNLDLGGSPNQAQDALTTRSAGNFSKIRYSLSHQQDIAPDLSVFAAWTWQLSDKNLDSSEKLYLGGADGVRAFPTGEAGGSEGQVLNLQLRWRLSPGWELSPFYDAGTIRVNRYNQFTGAPALNRYTLQGAGLSLAWQPDARSEYRLSWVRRLQANPNATSQGNDQDGTLRENRLWSSANWYF